MDDVRPVFGVKRQSLYNGFCGNATEEVCIFDISIMSVEEFVKLPRLVSSTLLFLVELPSLIKRCERLSRLAVGRHSEMDVS